MRLIIWKFTGASGHSMKFQRSGLRTWSSVASGFFRDHRCEQCFGKSFGHLPLRAGGISPTCFFFSLFHVSSVPPSHSSGHSGSATTHNTDSWSRHLFFWRSLTKMFHRLIVFRSSVLRREFSSRSTATSWFTPFTPWPLVHILRGPLRLHSLHPLRKHPR